VVQPLREINGCRGSAGPGGDLAGPLLCLG